MTDYSIYDWSTTAADNNDADGAIDWSELMAPDRVNDSARQMMARVREYINDRSPVRTSTGASNVYAITTASTPSALVDGMTYSFVAHQDNAGSSTFAPGSFGAKPLRSRSGTALQPKEIVTGQPVVASYKLSTDEWLIQNGAPQLYALYQSLLSGSSFGLSVGDVKLSMSSTPSAGFVRLRETARALAKADYPDLNAWASAQSYPWGSTSTTFNVPPAAGYLLRFAATDSSVDPAGPRTAGSTQTDALKSHTHTVSGTTSTDGAHTHGVGYSTAQSGASGLVRIGPVAGSNENTTSSGSHSHTVTGTAAATGDTETRGKNVAIHADMLASPALVASGLIGATGLALKYTTGTSGDPGSGYIGFDTTTLGSAVTVRISKTASNGADIGAFLASKAAGTTMLMTKVGAPQNFVSFALDGSWTDNTTYLESAIVDVVADATLTNADQMGALFSGSAGPIGDPGNDGATGPNTGLDFAFATGTSGDPTSGKLLFNSATVASVTQVNISETGRNGEALAAVLATWDDSTNTAHYGHLRIFAVADRTKFIELEITGTLTDAGSYRTIPVTYTAGGTLPDSGDVLAVVFERTGNKGADGVGSGSVTSVDLAVPTEFSVSGGPVTSSGTITIGKANQNANLVYAGPSTGSAAAPSFRSLVAADLPASGVTAGTYAAAKVTVAASGAVTAVTDGTLPTFQTFEYTGSSQTWARPSGCRAIRFKAIGGGGQGGGSTLAAGGVGAGGGAGAMAEGWLDVTSISSLTITIGKGGSSGAVAQAGEDGGATAVSNGGTNIVTCPGGKGGALATAASTASVFVASGGDGGGPVTGSSSFFSANYGASGGYSQRTSSTVAHSGEGADSPLGMGGRPRGGNPAAANSAGDAGLGFGSGGSGNLQINTTNQSLHKGGAGAPGLVIIEEYY